MEIGIIGLPKSGKTTVFNALTKGKAETAAYSTALAPNIGIARVEDSRLAGLETIFSPKRTIPAQVKYVDVAIPRGSAREEGPSRQLLDHLSKTDALLHVVRAFQDESVPHSEGSLDPERDIAIMNLELIFSDLAIQERRLKRIGDSLKGARPPEREALLQEQALLARIKSALEREIPIREQGLSEEEVRAMENYQFLTAKPLMIVLNIGEEQISQASSLEQALSSRHPQFPVSALCGELEMELAQLDETEAKEFLSAWGLPEAALPRLIRLSYQLLGLISFFTTVSGEVKAWTIRKNTCAPEAAGKVHSDMQRGFIRAEVISYDELVKCGSLAEARKQGTLHVEGKNYVVQDGDVITFLFSV